MAESEPLRWWSSPRRLLRRILHLDDTPHSIALGTAIGMFIGLTPTVGVQMMIVLVVAAVTRRFFHFNRVAGLLTVYVSNPITVVPLYVFFYAVGTWFVASTMTVTEFRVRLTGVFDSPAGDLAHFVFIDVGWPMLLGSAVTASIGAVITYPLIRRLLERRRGKGGISKPEAPVTASVESTR